MKTIIAAVLIGTFIASLPSAASAKWFGQDLTASIFSAVSSFFGKVVSAVSNTVSKVFSPSKSSEISCVPPVSPKPSVEAQHALGTMTITPEISEENIGKDNVITVSLASRVDSLSVRLGIDPLNPLRSSLFQKSNIVDWGPKQAELPNGGKGVNITMTSEAIQWETQEYVGENNRLQKRPTLPSQTYWVKLKAQQTTPWDSDENIGSYGWKDVQYNIHYLEGQSNFKTVSGKSVYYVGGPQFPVGKIARVGDNKKPVTVKAGEPFEIEVKPTGWQGGTLTINTGGTARVIGPLSITVKTGESAVFKLLPRGTYPVKGTIDIKNRCNELFSDNNDISKRYFNTQVGTFEAPIEFDFKGVAKENMRLTFQGGTFALDFEKPQSSLTVVPWLSLMDGEMVVAPAPGLTLFTQAVYKDNPREVAKNVLITPTEALTDKEGTAQMKVRAPNVTKEEVSRGILLKVSTPDIPDLGTEIQLLFTGVTIDITKPAQKPTEPQPAPTPAPEKSKKVSPQNVIVYASTTSGNLVEGTKITFTAKLTMADGSLETTSDVKWAVLGKIGTITADGVFTAKLDESIAELGESFGFVTATYTDSEGNAFLGQSTLLKVKAFVPNQSETGG